MTDRGRGVAQQIDTILQELETELGRALDPKEGKRLRRGLEHLVNNVVEAIFSGKTREVALGVRLSSPPPR